MAFISVKCQFWESGEAIQLQCQHKYIWIMVWNEGKTYPKKMRGKAKKATEYSLWNSQMEKIVHVLSAFYVFSVWVELVFSGTCAA